MSEVSAGKNPSSERSRTRHNFSVILCFKFEMLAVRSVSMAHYAVILCSFGVFHKGLSALVETQWTVLAAVGGEALLSCLLTQPKDVLQVTWQKPLPVGEKTVATYNKHFGQKVNPDFRDKVEFEAAGLQNSSIVIRNVTEQDEGCYHCLFNSYPEGALTGRTCLKLYELHEPVLHVGESNSTEEPLVSCSATGRPAPTVTLSVLPHNGHFSNHSSVGVTNTNGTVTVTTTAVLSRLHDNSTQVGCAAQVLSAPQIEVLVMIPEVKQSSDADVSDEEPGSDGRGRYFMVVMVFVIVAVGCVAAAVMLIKKPKNRDLENNDTEKTSITDTHEPQTPSFKQENSEIRKRTPPEKNKTDSPKPSTARRRHSDQSQDLSKTE